MRVTPRVALFAVAALLTACPEVKPAPPDGGGDGGCAGQLTCDCRAGDVCDVGECVAGSCTDCRRGEAACICRSNGTCNAGLRCEGNTCSVCPAGEQNCACNAGSCNTGFTCANDVCVPDTCTAGLQGCPCRSGGAACDGTMYCDSSSVCRPCAADVPGCACESNACLGGLVCETGNCREALSCADLVTSGACVANQVCNEGSGLDAMCVASTCVTGFYWNGVSCAACAGGDCNNVPSCDDVADGGLGADCAAQFRECVPAGETGSCGGCLQGYTVNGAGACVPAATCGSVTCPLSQYCDRDGTPTCRDWPCDAGSAMGSSSVCTSCTGQTCAGDGLSGRIWPFRSSVGTCVCETLDDYFVKSGATSVAVKCDADQDGWVNGEADVDAVRSGAALRNNSRCTIRTADRVRLFDEYGVSVDILSCGPEMKKASRPGPDGGYINGGLPLYADGGIMPLPDGGNACPSPVPLRLLETERNDTLLGTESSPAFPTYPFGAADSGTGRYLEAREVNALTKACVSALGDFDDDTLADLGQRQLVTAQRTAAIPYDASETARLRSFAYFIETTESYWQSYGTGREGVLVIRERNRCNQNNTDFPLRYAPGVAPTAPVDGYSVSQAAPYWRNCARNRDVSYDSSSQPPNSDFAQWMCESGSGTCTLPPPAHRTRVFPQGITNEYFRDFGLCHLNGAQPVDGLWRGLNHHSQFKCVGTVNAGNPQPPSYLVSSFGTGVNQMIFNACAPRHCTSADDPTCRKLLGNGKQTAQPILDCSAVAVAPDNTVGFAAVQFQTSDPYSYTRGCVDENRATSASGTWGYDLCPYPQFSAQDGGSGDGANFGRYSCYGKGTNWLWAAADGGWRPSSTMKWATDAGTNSNDSGWSPSVP